MSSCDLIADELAAMRADIESLNNKFASKQELENLKNQFVTKQEFNAYKQYVEKSFDAVSKVTRYLVDELRNFTENKYKELNDFINDGIDGVQSDVKRNVDWLNRKIDEWQKQNPGRDPFSRESLQEEIQRRQSEDYRLWEEIKAARADASKAREKAEQLGKEYVDFKEKNNRDHDRIEADLKRETQKLEDSIWNVDKNLKTELRKLDWSIKDAVYNFNKEINKISSELQKHWNEITSTKKKVETAEEKAEKAEKKADEALKKVEKAFNDIGDIANDLKQKAIEISQIKFDIKTLQVGLAALTKSIPGLVGWAVKSAIASWLLSEGIKLITNLIAQLMGKVDLSYLEGQVKFAIKLANEAKDDARAGITLAVKAEGKADTANSRIDELKKDVDNIVAGALSAMTRLENEIKSLTESTRQALLRLQGRIADLEKYTGELTKVVTGLQNYVLDLAKYVGGLAVRIGELTTNITGLNAKIKDLTTFINSRIKDLQGTITQFKTDILKELDKLKTLTNKIPEILGQIALFALQIAGITATIAGIQLLLRRIAPGGTVVQNNTYVTNNYVTNNDNRRTTVMAAQSPVDMSLLQRIDRTTTANLGITGTILGISNIMNTKLGDLITVGGKAIGISGKLLQGFSWLVIDRALNVLTFAATIHNAAMLSQNIVATLTQAMQNAVDLVGIKDDNKNPVEVSTLINTSITNAIKSAVGKDNYEYWVKQWNAYNRIYQAASNLFSAFMSMGDTIINALQVIGGQSAQGWNALRAWGKVAETAYKWFNPTPNFSNPLLTKLNSLDEAATMVETVTQQPLAVKSEKENLEQASKDLADSLAQLPNKPQGKEIPEAAKVKTEEDEKKANSKGKELDAADLEADE